MSDQTDRHLAETFKVAMQLRLEMRAQGASEESCRQALERSLRAAWPTRDESQWPQWALAPRCSRCDGYGLVMQTVTNRLGCVVEEGTPCTCFQGTRYREKPKAEDAFTEAGKTTKPKPMTRFGR